MRQLLILIKKEYWQRKLKIELRLKEKKNYLELLAPETMQLLETLKVRNCTSFRYY